MSRRKSPTSGTEEEVFGALQALESRPIRVRAGDWPGALIDLDSPGLYSWWVDSRGALDLTRGIGAEIPEGRIYAGQAGATKWPSGKRGKATLRTRIAGNHLRGRVQGSTFRLTLAAALWRHLDLEVSGPKRLTPTSESRLTGWIADHLSVAVFPFIQPDPLAWIEARVLGLLDPPLNLEGMEPTPVRLRLKVLRRSLARGTEAPRGRLV